MNNRFIVKQGSRYSVASPLLMMFSAPFIIWQMGILYFSGTSMSLFGRTPIPLSAECTVLVIAAGYIASAAAAGLFPRYTVYMQRALMPVALLSSVLVLFPFEAAVITALFYISAFICVFSIGTSLSLAAQHFTLETVWRDGIISMVLGGVAIALLQNDTFEVSFTVFAVSSVFLVAAQTVFYYMLPAKIEAEYVTRENKVEAPKIIFIGAWLINTCSTLLICFASSFAESVSGGVSALYLSAAVTALLLVVLQKSMKGAFLRIFGVFFAISVIGFVLALLSLQLPPLKLVACIFLGFIVVLANLWVFFAAVSFSFYPTRFVGTIGAAMGLVFALVHSGLLELLRNDASLLYGIYALVSVVLLLIYYFTEPYFIYALNSKKAPVLNLPSKEEASAQDPGDESRPTQFGRLSEQEYNLALLILAGHTETSAASRMNISLNTLKSYRKNLYFKLDIHSKRELFELARDKSK